MPGHHMYLPRDLIRAALLATALCAAGARADGTGAPLFSLSGYGTLGLVHSSEKNADFTSSSIKPNGAGHSHNWSGSVDSLIAGQVTANFSPQLSAVLQVIAEQNYDNSYWPHVEWANVKYQITPDFSVRAGRTVLPNFLLSETRKVSYTYPWVRPPVEVYSLVPISNSDGVDASYRFHAGGVTSTVQFIYGSTEPKLPRGGGTAIAKDALGLAYTAEIGAATVHIMHHQARITLDSYKPLFDGFRQFGPQGIAIADRYDTNGKRFDFIGVGASYDPGKWFVMGEWGATNSHAVLGRRSAWYASGGYRFGKFTPYLTFARAKADSATSDPGLTLSTLPPFLAAPAAALNAGLNASLGMIPVQKTLSAGGRWDFAKNTALKLQFDHTRLGAGSAGTLINVQPGFQPGGSFNVLSVTVDIIF